MSRVPFYENIGVARECRGILLDLAGVFCPSSLLVEIEPKEAALEEEAFIHESFHYHQILSTPLGFHIVLLEQNRALTMGRATRQLARKLGGNIHIPLMCYYRHPESSLPKSFSDNIELWFATERYLKWLLDKDDILEGESINTMCEGINETLRLVCNVLEYTSSRFPAKPITVSMDQYDIPTLGGVIVTGRMVLENAASLATAQFMLQQGDTKRDVRTLTMKLKESKPQNYYNLIAVLSEAFPDLSLDEFVRTFATISDIALFGLPISVDGDSNCMVVASDFHPSMRFIKMFNLLRKNDGLVKLLSNPVETERGERELCNKLGWKTRHEIVGDLMESLHRRIAFKFPGFAWIEKEFIRFLRGRLKNPGLFLGVLESTRAVLVECVTNWDPGGRVGFQEFLSRNLRYHIRSRLRHLQPPLVMRGDRFTVRDKNKATILLAGYVAYFFHLAYFVQRLILTDDLRYPFRLRDDMLMEKVFEDLFGLKPSNIYPFSDIINANLSWNDTDIRA